jgi:hypothetical protein
MLGREIRSSVTDARVLVLPADIRDVQSHPCRCLSEAEVVTDDSHRTSLPL